MTISTEPTPLFYPGNGSTTAFPVTWKYFAKSHVVATLRSSSGTETVWVLDTDYTLTAAGVDAGGTLTATVAHAIGETLVISLDPPNTQTSSLPLGGAFPSTTVEAALDQGAQRDSKLEALFNRTLRVPETDTQSGSELALPIDSARASKFLAFDGNGSPIAAAGTTASLTPVSAFMDTLLDDANAAAARTTLGFPNTSTPVTTDATQTLTSKTLTTPAISSPTLTGNLNFGSVAIQDLLEADGIFNLTFKATHNTPTAGDLTIELVGADGNALSATNAGSVIFKKTSHPAVGLEAIEVIEPPTPLVIPATATLGFAAGESGQIYPYIYWDGTTRRIAVTGRIPLPDYLSSSTTISTGSDSQATFYGTSTTVDVRIRCLGEIEITSGTPAGTWDTAATSLHPGGWWRAMRPARGADVDSVSDHRLIVTTGSLHESTLLKPANGTWTPVLTFATPGNLNVVYGTQVGRYMRVGKIVVLTFNIQTSTFTHTTASGALRITGMPAALTPVTAAGYLSVGVFSGAGITKANYTDFNVLAFQNSAILNVYGLGSGQVQDAVTAADMPTTGTVLLQGTIMYETT